MKAFNIFIIFAGGSSWETYTRRIHYEALTNFGKIIVLEPQPRFRTRIRSFIQKDYEKIRFRHQVLRKDNMVIISTPFTLPLKVYRVSALLRKMQCHIIRKILLREINKLGGTLKNTIIIYTDGRQRLWWEALEGGKKCFDLTDAPWLLSNKSWKERFEILKDVIWMLSNCDNVFCTSMRLRGFASHFNELAYFLPNTWGDIQHSGEKLPDSLTHLDACKKIGFLGNINDWIDLDLVEYIATNISNAKLIFVGRINGSTTFRQRFKKLVDSKILIYLGAVSQSQIGKTIDLFDVCIIPYTLDQFKTYVHPNKLYQYLSRGKPIVTTSFTPDLSTFSDLIYVAKSYEHFLSEINAALDEHCLDMISKRKKFATANSAIERTKQRIAFLQL
jgi:hypothetical protein